LRPSALAAAIATGGAQPVRRRRGAQGLEASTIYVLAPTALTRPSDTLSHSRARGTGCIHWDELLAGDLDCQDFKHLAREDEAVVLRTLLEIFICRAWCLRRPCDGSALLTLPQIKNPRWADYWQQQSYAVMLVIRTSDGEIRWMDVPY
jgi:hypothetical protein